jgi:hypothetical protein
MDKFGWQKPYIEPSKTGIQAAAEARKMRKHAKAVEVIAQGNLVSYSVVTGEHHDH